MWTVAEDKLNFHLPRGFLLIEEPEFVHLFHEEERIASFHHKVAHPAILQSVAEEYLRRETS